MVLSVDDEECMKVAGDGRVVSLLVYMLTGGKSAKHRSAVHDSRYADTQIKNNNKKWAGLVVGVQCQQPQPNNHENHNDV